MSSDLNSLHSIEMINAVYNAVSIGPSYVKAGEVALAMQMLYPDRVAVEMHPFENRDAFKQWLSTSHDRVTYHYFLLFPGL